jgi:hypothetical protein
MSEKLMLEYNGKVWFFFSLVDLKENIENFTQCRICGDILHKTKDAEHVCTNPPTMPQD